MFCVAFTQASLHGYVMMYVTPNIPWLSERAVYFFGATVGLSVFVFVRSFLQTSTHLPKTDKVFHVLSIFYLIALVLALVGQYSLSYQIDGKVLP